MSLEHTAQTATTTSPQAYIATHEPHTDFDYSVPNFVAVVAAAGAAVWLAALAICLFAALAFG